MNRLMLDHFRRWSWVLMAGAAAEFALGWLIATGPQYSFEFWAFAVALWPGAVLLSYDMKRGFLRPVAVLPLTGRQMGRSWWVATVPTPAIILAALLFLGAGACGHFRPNHAFPVEPLALVSLYNLVWLGISFTMIFNSTRGFGRSGWEFIGNGLISWLAILLFFGSMLLCQGASKDAFKSAVLLGGGALLTFVGWLLAEQFDPGRAGIYLGRIEPPNVGRGGVRLTPLESRIAPGEFHVPVASGGVRFLLSTACVRAFFWVAAMVGLMALLWQWQNHRLPQPLDLALFATMASFMSCWFIGFYQFLPMVRLLRFLRTLPISASGLAAMMLALAILPLLALGVLAAAIASLALGPSVGLMVLNGFVFILAPAALGVFFAVWQGGGAMANVLMLITLFGFLLGRLWLQGHYHYQELPLILAGATAVLTLLVAFVLTRCALTHSRRAYSVHANPFGSFPVGTSS